LAPPQGEIAKVDMRALGPMNVAAGPLLHGDLCDLLRSAHADQMPT